MNGFPCSMVVILKAVRICGQTQYVSEIDDNWADDYRAHEETHLATLRLERGSFH